MTYPIVILAKASEQRIRLLSDKYKLPLETVEQLSNVDYTDKGIYTEWLVRSLKKNQFKYPEDSDKIVESLTAFDKLKNAPSFDRDKNILSYTPSSLYDLVQGMSREDLSNKEKVRDLKDNQDKYIEQGAELLVEVDGIKIYRVVEPLAAMALSEGTNWCTKGSHWANHYLEQSPLYIFVREAEKLAQLHLGPEDHHYIQFKHPNDESIGFEFGDNGEATEVLVEWKNALLALSAHVPKLAYLLSNGFIYFEVDDLKKPGLDIWEHPIIGEILKEMHWVEKKNFFFGKEFSEDKVLQVLSYNPNLFKHLGVDGSLDTFTACGVPFQLIEADPDIIIVLNRKLESHFKPMTITGSLIAGGGGQIVFNIENIKDIGYDYDSLGQKLLKADIDTDNFPEWLKGRLATEWEGCNNCGKLINSRIGETWRDEFDNRFCSEYCYYDYEENQLKEQVSEWIGEYLPDSSSSERSELTKEIMLDVSYPITEDKIEKWLYRNGHMTSVKTSSDSRSLRENVEGFLEDRLSTRESEGTARALMNRGLGGVLGPYLGTHPELLTPYLSRHPTTSGFVFSVFDDLMLKGEFISAKIFKDSPEWMLYFLLYFLSDECDYSTSPTAQYFIQTGKQQLRRFVRTLGREEVERLIRKDGLVTSRGLNFLEQSLNPVSVTARTEIPIEKQFASIKSFTSALRTRNVGFSSKEREWIDANKEEIRAKLRSWGRSIWEDRWKNRWSWEEWVRDYVLVGPEDNSEYEWADFDVEFTDYAPPLIYLLQNEDIRIPFELMMLRIDPELGGWVSKWEIETILHLLSPIEQSRCKNYIRRLDKKRELTDKQASKSIPLEEAFDNFKNFMKFALDFESTSPVPEFLPERRI